jgi:hypothetical protein
MIKAGSQKGAEMKKTKIRHWTKEDVRTLKSMAKDKLGVKKIAKALKRTPGATSVMAATRRRLLFRDAHRIEHHCLPVARLRHADGIGRCLLSVVTRKAFAHTEFFSV